MDKSVAYAFGLEPPHYPVPAIVYIAEHTYDPHAEENEVVLWRKYKDNDWEWIKSWEQYPDRYVSGEGNSHYPVPALILHVDYTYCDYVRDDGVSDPYITIYQTVVYRDDGDTWCEEVRVIGLDWAR